MQALDDIRVLDFSHVIAGPFSTFYLAQMGAQVTKVENPVGGDVMRQSKEGARTFTAFNDGKDCVEIDIASEVGRAQAQALARDCDVFVNNYRPGTLERYGLGYEAVKAMNPRVIYCAISGYGYVNPELSARGAYDHVIQALTGMAMLTGNEGDPPIKVGFPVVDVTTGILGALAILTAVRERDRHGSGCFLDVSMWAAALQLMYPFSSETLSSGARTPRVGNKAYSGSPAADTFQCADGWIALGASTPTHIEKLLAVLGIAPDLVAPLMESPGPGRTSFARARDPQKFKDLLAQHIRGRSAEQLDVLLNAQGVPAARVRRLDEFAREAVDSGLLAPSILGSGDSQAKTPGLGWRVVR